MIAPHDVAELHVELTERCNAACPMCGRLTADGREQPFLRGRELSVHDVRSFFPLPLLKQLSRFRLCGNFGDPAVARDVLPIVEYLRGANPALRLTMNTNGGVRMREWWFELGRLFRAEGSAVLFAVDGLADTHAIYRRRTSFQAVLANAEAFIRGGGRAHWVYLVFAHNEHQIDAARHFARSLGFSQFTVKRTKRFWSRSGALEWEREYRDARDGSTVVLRAPADPELRNPRLRVLDERGVLPAQGPVHCLALGHSSVYVSAGGLLLPCCWIGAEHASADGATEGSWHTLIAAAGGEEGLDLRRRSFAEILAGSAFTRLSRVLGGEGKPLATCLRVCSRGGSVFSAQFDHEPCRSDPQVYEC